MPGFDNKIVFASNVDFTGNSLTQGTPQISSNGQLLIGSATGPNGACLNAGVLTSPGGTVAIGYSAPNITLDISGSHVGETITGDAGGALSPTLGNWNILGGSTGLTTSGSVSTLSLTGVLNLANGGTSASLTASNGGIFYSTASAGAILAGTATARQMLQSGASTTPAWSTTTWPATSTINQILYSSAPNTIAGLATANNAVLTTGTTGIPVLTALAANGQLIIGSGSGAPIAATLTAGTGVSIVNAANSITINAVGGGSTWIDAAVSFNALVNNGYFVSNTATATLPSAPSQGDTIKFIATAAHVVTIQANAGQSIRIGSAISSVAGTATSSGTAGDSITIVYQAASATWYSLGAPENVWTTA